MKTQQFTSALFVLAIIQFSGIGSAMATGGSNWGPSTPSYDYWEEVCVKESYKYFNQCIDTDEYDEACPEPVIYQMYDQNLINQCNDIIKACWSKAHRVYHSCMYPYKAKKPGKKSIAGTCS